MATVIFDFDGTLADSFELSVEIMHEVLGRTSRLSHDEIEALRGLPARQVMKEVGVRWWRLPVLLTRGRKRMHARIDEVRPFAGLAPALAQLRKDGNKLFILTSNSESNVRRFLAAHQLEQYFDKVYGGAGLFNKAGKIRDMLRKNHSATDDCWYIGDEVRDVVAARQAGVRCIGVSWGFNTAAVLRECNPAALASRPADIPRIIEQRTEAAA